MPETAALLDVSRGYVHDLIKRGGLPAVRLSPPPSGHYRVPVRALEQWLAGHQNGAVAA